MKDGKLGMITTPAQMNPLVEGVPWCGDNGCFGKGYPGDSGFLSWLDERKWASGLCRFVTAPDVLFDAPATLKRSRPFLGEIRGRGFPVAFVAQDGQEDLPLPWDEFDVLFIGGSTEWKLAYPTSRLVADAHAHGKWVHMGRVNSKKRLLYARRIGCRSVDGTYLVFGPDKNLPKLLRWLEEVESDYLPSGAD